MKLFSIQAVFFDFASESTHFPSAASCFALPPNYSRHAFSPLPAGFATFPFKTAAYSILAPAHYCKICRPEMDTPIFLRTLILQFHASHAARVLPFCWPLLAFTFGIHVILFPRRSSDMSIFLSLSTANQVSAPFTPQPDLTLLNTQFACLRHKIPVSYQFYTSRANTYASSKAYLFLYCEKSILCLRVFHRLNMTHIHLLPDFCSVLFQAFVYIIVRLMILLPFHSKDNALAFLYVVSRLFFRRYYILPANITSAGERGSAAHVADIDDIDFFFLLYLWCQRRRFLQ